MGRLVSGSVPYLFHGVTQLNPLEAKLGQVKLAENCRMSVTTGLGKRYPTDLVSTGWTISEDESYHTITLGDGDVYIVALRERGIRAFNLSKGFEVAIPDPDFSYLRVGDFSVPFHQMYSVLPMGEEAYVLNRTQAVMGHTRRQVPGEGWGEHDVISTFTFYDLQPWETYEIAFTEGETIRADWSRERNRIWLASEFARVLNEKKIGTVKTPYPWVVELHHYSTVPVPAYSDNSTRKAVHQVDSARPSLMGAHLPQAIAWVNVADYTVSYTIVLDGVKCTHTTPNAGTNMVRTPDVSVLTILSKLKEKIDATGPASEVAEKHSWTCQVNPKGYLELYTANKEATLDYADDMAGLGQSLRDGAFYAIRNTIDRPELLPEKAPFGYSVQVKGLASDPEEDSGYWLTFKQVDDTDSGVWEEGCDPRLPDGLDKYTMPYVLRLKAHKDFVTDKNPEGLHFLFGPGGWEPRKKGDDNSNDWPAFVSTREEDGSLKELRRITALGVHRDRLTFVSGPHVSFSETGEWQNFFRTTVRTVKASDRIDFTVNFTDNVNIQWMTSGNRALMLWDSYGKQIAVTAGDAALTPQTLRADVVGTYEVDLRAEPIRAGSEFLFLESDAQYSRLRSLKAQGDVELFGSDEYCQHVPEYIDGVPHQILSSTANKTIFVVCRDAFEQPRREVFVNSYELYQGQRMMNSWHKWIFPYPVRYLAMDTDGTLLVVMHSPDDRLVVSRMNFTMDDSYHKDSGYPMLLDNRRTWDTEPSSAQMLPDEVKHRFGRRWVTGIPYVQKWMPLTLYPEMKPKGTDYLKLRRVFVYFEKTVRFTGAVLRKARDAQALSFEGRRVGGLGGILGKIPEVDSRISIAAMAANFNVDFEFVNDSIYDANFTRLEWEGFFHARHLNW